MTRIVFICCIALFALFGCQSENDNTSRKLTNKAIDISDFVVYAGSPTGGVEVRNNNLRKSELMTYYFKSKYNPIQYEHYSMDFNSTKLTYIYGANEANLFKVVSGYTFNGDSLFVIDLKDSLIYVGLGNDQNRLYRKAGLVRYPYSALRDTVLVSEKESYDLQKVLGYMGYSSLSEMTNVKDTIAWCNMKYIFTK